MIDYSAEGKPSFSIKKDRNGEFGAVSPNPSSSFAADNTDPHVAQGAVHMVVLLQPHDIPNNSNLTRLLKLW